jgi:ParB family chromosome partitioning protein
MNRDAYIKANPEREADLEPDTTHVVIDGSSRLAAAREAGLTSIKVMVSDDQGANSEEILESALVANIHRQDLEELDEARALQRLLAIHGSQTALAKRLHRSQGWVSQRLALLSLTPELQDRVGKEPIDLLRAVGSKPPEQQEAVLEALKEERARKEAERQERKRKKQTKTDAPATQEADGPKGYYGVIEDGGTEEPSSTPSGHETADNRARKQAVPEPRTGTGNGSSAEGAEADDQRVRKVPFDQPGELAMLLDRRVESDDAFFDLLRILGEKALQRDSARLRDLARLLADQTTAETS